MNNKVLIIGVLLNVFVLSAFSQSAEKENDSIKKQEKKVSIAGVPKISYNRSSGLGVGAMGMLLFKFDTASSTPKSHIMLSASYTTEKSWYAMGVLQLYLIKDRLRITTGGGYMDFHFQTFYDTDGTSEVEIPYVNYGGFFFLNPLVKVVKYTYVGPTIGMMRTKVKFDMPDGSETTQTYDMNSLGLAANFDSRSNVYYPTSGLFSTLNFSTNPNWFKNDSAFSRLIFNVNYYYPFNQKMVLASRFATKVSFGNVPFTGENIVGGKDIRGYTKGNYRGDQVYSLQSEFRWNFYKRLGMVGFAGLALEVDSDNNVSPVLPGVGAGLRFMMLPADKLNVGVDVAVGRNDWGIYFRIGEAF